MPVKPNKNQPGFYLFPINNTRTGWQPVSFPVILVVPHRYNHDNLPIQNSNISSLRVYIESVPRQALVTGHLNIGKRSPDHELYSQTIDIIELANRQIIVEHAKLYDADGIQTDDLSLAKTFEYTSATGIHDTIEYIPGADYYDLSNVTIDVENLPENYYTIVYEGQYFERTISNDIYEQFVCINTASNSIASYRINIDHPGKILAEFYRHTPQPYLTNTSKALDTTPQFYRPFTDILNDIADEQNLIPYTNLVYEAPAEAIPYLSSLLGWDLPYFPESLDSLRRAVLRRTVEFQNLKGSRRALTNLFRLFGFEILISNLWWSSDGKLLIRPDEALPPNYESEEIKTVETNQIDCIINAYTPTKFETIEIPLLYRPQEISGLDDFTALRDGGAVTILLYVVENESDQESVLNDIATAAISNPDTYGETTNCVVDDDGFIFPSLFTTLIDYDNLAGSSEIRIIGKLGKASSDITTGTIIPVSRKNVTLNRETNKLSITLDGYSQFTNHKIYGFAIYKRYTFSVPEILVNLASNRFDIQVLTDNLKEFADPAALEFALEFLRRLKAFNSCLHTVRTRIEMTETYEVTDLSVGGVFAQNHTTDIGKLQVPPAIIPTEPENNNCTIFTPEDLGYKETDIQLRLRKLANMPEEHAAWQELDNRTSEAQPTSRLAANQPAPERETCKYTIHGQDRITLTQRNETRTFITTPNPNANTTNSPTKLSSNRIITAGTANTTNANNSGNADYHGFGAYTAETTEIRQPICDLDNATDYIYKGRVDDELLHQSTAKQDETHNIKALSLSMGFGVYWTYPGTPIVSTPGTKFLSRKSRSGRLQYSGTAPDNSKYYTKGVQEQYLTAPYNTKLSNDRNSLLGRLYHGYGVSSNETIHYSNRIGMPNPSQQHNLALQRPSLAIEKSTLHIPGCRFIKMNALLETYTHETYELRPWDIRTCGIQNTCNPRNELFTITESTDGEQLSYDLGRYAVLGNGLTPDIENLNSHATSIAEADVIHTVYMNNSQNDIVIFTNACDYGTDVTDEGLITTNDPLFKSHNGSSDYADGYKCEFGIKTATYSGIDDTELTTALGLEYTTHTDYLFTLGCGIRDESVMNHRMDGGTILAGVTPSINSTTIYLDDYNDLDFDPDHLSIKYHIIGNENLNCDTLQLDLTIMTLMETVG